MLTLPQIIKKTRRLQLMGAKYVRIKQVKKGWDSQGRGFIACSSYSTHIINQYGNPVKNENPKQYVTVFTFLDTKLHVLISCSCPDFLYRREVALTNKGAAEIEYSNGEQPTTTNPSLTANCCKHCVALYEKYIYGKIKPK